MIARGACTSRRGSKASIGMSAGDLYDLEVGRVQVGRVQQRKFVDCLRNIAEARWEWAMSRSRRTKAEMAELRTGLYEIVKADQPMTVRQVFYRAVVAGLVEKTELEYQCTVARLLLEMRRTGQIPYSWIADNTRWMRKPKTYTGLADFIERHQQAYRRDLWAEADVYTEIWCEKEALAGILYDVTWDYDVPLIAQS
jgi:hypothetical protein